MLFSNHVNCVNVSSTNGIVVTLVDFDQVFTRGRKQGKYEYIKAVGAGIKISPFFSGKEHGL